MKYTLSATDPYKLLLWGTVAEHEEYSGILKMVDAAEATDQNSSMKVYSLKATVASTVIPVVG
ncbi:MAG: hypothetical protein R3C11_18600 [Planctomycetaceae bacterium]